MSENQLSIIRSRHSAYKIAVKLLECVGVQMCNPLRAYPPMQMVFSSMSEQSFNRSARIVSPVFPSLLEWYELLCLIKNKYNLRNQSETIFSDLKTLFITSEQKYRATSASGKFITNSFGEPSFSSIISFTSFVVS